MNRNAVYSNLFCLCDAPLSDEGEAQGAERLQEPFAGLLPHLDFSSTCYLISRKRPGEATYFEDLLQEVSAFLEQNRFLQASVRPVHPFSGNDANAWIETYLRFLRACKPFQQEGYREQIIARLRVFPVIFLKDAAAVMEAGPFLSFLQETFFLPSILVPSRAIDEVASLSTRQDAPPWVRVYATDASSFEPQRALEILHAHEVFDKLLEDDAEAFPEGADSSDQESLILNRSGDVRSCAKKDHLLSAMELVGISYRVNPQGGTGWHQLCDRMATRFIRKGLHEPAITVWQSSARAYPSEAVPSSLLLHIALSHYEIWKRQWRHSQRPGKGPRTPRTYSTTWANASSDGGTTSKRLTAFRKRSNSASRIPCAWKLTTTVAFPITIWKNTMRLWRLLQRPRRPA